jgi:hypothetical protein
MFGPKKGDQAKPDPDRSRDDRNSCENVARFRPKRAGPTHAAQRAGQSATAAALHQHQENQENRQQR